MKYCPITYEPIVDSEMYSTKGLRLLSPRLKMLHPLPFTAIEQRKEAIHRAGKMSIQGIQPKLSAVLRMDQGLFEIVNQKGNYILKTQTVDYPELPENEAITMTLASFFGIEVPIHGLIYSKDNSWTYFIKRFDREPQGRKLPLEDFSQLLGKSRETKYNSSMEQVADVIRQYCTFPKIEYLQLFKRTLFNYLIGNEDMHLKNFSLLTRKNKITLSPAYDLINSTIALGNSKEELALPLNGKKNNLRKKDLFEYFALNRLMLRPAVIEQETQALTAVVPKWMEFIKKSFLSDQMKKNYLELLQTRLEVMK